MSDLDGLASQIETGGIDMAMVVFPDQYTRFCPVGAAVHHAAVTDWECVRYFDHI
jgi:hypothetical protein